MNGIKKLGAVLAVSTLFVTSTFAESRPRNEAEWRRAERREERREERRDDRRYERRGRGNGYVSGVVQRIDYRRDVMEIRDRRSGRHITVDARRADRRRYGIDISDIRRGDFVELEGAWVRGNVFQADRIDALDSRR
jgi:hypothetical protein